MRRLCLTALLLLALPGSAHADHVTAVPTVSARIADMTATHAAVDVTWQVRCEVSGGPATGPTTYSVDGVYLIDQDTGERIFLGGYFGPSSETAREIVTRIARDRRLAPNVKARCNSDGHESLPAEVTGEVVVVPARAAADPGGGGGGGGGGDGGTAARTCDATKLGNRRANTLIGTLASDRLVGLAGNDVLRGRGGSDCLFGGAGRDRLFGDAGDDALHGGGGNDVLTGGSGENTYDAGRGRDLVLARNGVAERVLCGPGRDRAVLDRADRVLGCERVSRRG